ncbi:uncharacterized protein K444DRAFT_131978 [Hyaloscypha bicolor E]|jgi:hypothetical protein|uniref:Uncharacterized protein n=1 Tax=Hyaloscypha bicolor E TaxID=1095630 RepID=A0A2J6ST41_9HELO|nr:uncharacterized protein K444DRAFT_131978 [Hyaloscypha bicolor E]PMD53909.1 hypothetical protein K444DRAFT_131978 [Hyaloscypha bicolor E]
MPSSQEALRSQEGSEKAVVLINSLPVDDCVEGRLHDPRSWRGVVLRIFWFLTVLLLMCVSAASAIKNLWDPSLPYLNVSRLLLVVLYLGIYYGQTSFDIRILYMYQADEFDNHSLYPRHMIQDLHRCSDLDRLCGFYPLGGGDEGNEIHARNNQSPGV